MAEDLLHQFLRDVRNASWLEYTAVVAGIASVWFSRLENILVYPVGLVNTTIYIYLSASADLYGEAGVNFYYTIMSIYGWFLWSRRDVTRRPIVQIKFSTKQEWLHQILFFLTFYILIFFVLHLLRRSFAPGAIPWADAFASATAFTGMWLMARKKVESWYWWIATNIASIPLYFVKHFVLTSVYYLILLVMAVMGLMTWKKNASAE